MAKYETHDLLEAKLINETYMKLLERFMSGSDDVREKCKKWFGLSCKYVQYYARGGREFLRESEMKGFHLEKLAPQRVHAPRSSTLRALPADIHAVNTILIQGKAYPEDPKVWH